MDNVATSVMNLAITKYGGRNPGEPIIFTDCDPSHCIDLLAKDSAKVKCFKELYEEVKSVMAFLTDGKMKGLKNKLMERGSLTDTGECNYKLETRFNNQFTNKSCSLILCALCRVKSPIATPVLRSARLCWTIT